MYSFWRENIKILVLALPCNEHDKETPFEQTYLPYSTTALVHQFLSRSVRTLVVSIVSIN